MYLDIEPNGNLAEGAIATFNTTGPGRVIRAVQVRTWLAVTGWSGDGPVPARWTPIEESGDGPAFLVSGGPHGVRLARIADPAQAGVVRWDLKDPAQWGEAFLICTPETATA